MKIVVDSNLTLSCPDTKTTIGCYSTFEFSVGDVKIDHNAKSTADRLYIICPKCKNKIKLDKRYERFTGIESEYKPGY